MSRQAVIKTLVRQALDQTLSGTTRKAAAAGVLTATGAKSVRNSDQVTDHGELFHYQFMEGWPTFRPTERGEATQPNNRYQIP